MATTQPPLSTVPTPPKPVMDARLRTICDSFVIKYHEILMHKATIACGEDFDYPAPKTTEWKLETFMKAINNLIDLSKYMQDEYAVPNSVVWVEGKTYSRYAMWMRRWEVASRLKGELELYETVMQWGLPASSQFLRMMAGLVAQI